MWLLDKVVSPVTLALSRLRWEIGSLGCRASRAAVSHCGHRDGSPYRCFFQSLMTRSDPPVPAYMVNGQTDTTVSYPLTFKLCVCTTPQKKCINFFFFRFTYLTCMDSLLTFMFICHHVCAWCFGGQKRAVIPGIGVRVGCELPWQF